jgi:metal-responsive CopG/Arc/MetJ family transcriptional regulator
VLYEKGNDMKDKKAISIRNIPAELLEKAKEIAAQSDRSFSQVVRDLLREYVAENEKKPEKKK